VYTRNHAIVSAVIGLLLTVTTQGVAPELTVVSAVLAGTVIDLDHFAVARHQSGSWAAVRRGLADPRRFLTRQTELFEHGEVGVLQRLLSHTLVGGATVAAVSVVDQRVAFVVAVSLYGHVLTGLVADVSRVNETVTHAEPS
jgi:hypothetical protein